MANLRELRANDNQLTALPPSIIYQGGCEAREGAILQWVTLSGAPCLTAPAVAFVRKRDQSSARQHNSAGGVAYAIDIDVYASWK